MSTHDGYYQQVDGLAMGSPPAPMLANGWLSKFDDIIKGDADLFARYMDDIIRNINKDKIQEKLNEINNIHPSLKFTIERENNGEIAFLDMSIKRTHGNFVSKWYTKPTNTGLTLNFHALAPKQSKRSVVSGLYRGKVSDNFKRTLNNIKAPCRIIFTLNKLKSCLPSLKPTVEKSLKSGVVYKFSCPRCSSCYVGQTSRHLICRFKEHRRNGPVADHWKECERELSIDDVTILCSNSKSTYHLMTLEALFINQLKPSLNTKDEYRFRPLLFSDLCTVYDAMYDIPEDGISFRNILFNKYNHSSGPLYVLVVCYICHHIYILPFFMLNKAIVLVHYCYHFHDTTLYPYSQSTSFWYASVYDFLFSGAHPWIFSEMASKSHILQMVLLIVYDSLRILIW
ncbi:uncharacterized protein LOC130621255 [Hydractinia symbiolongicarpus]|uniref:uncharacterized protein LOC130621255 n=1 Tax=Hydractinia symbiolongicarpus TaxID=13093 RepID=UPI00255109D5|nr:uncharacterized protein LOC130621255 [Hydractinia symbiolongicarpus]